MAVERPNHHVGVCHRRSTASTVDPRELHAPLSGDLQAVDRTRAPPPVERVRISFPWASSFAFVTDRARPAGGWLGLVGACFALAAAVGGGFGLQDVSREVLASGSEERAGALRRLRADGAARGRRAAAERRLVVVERRRRSAARSRPIGELRPGDGYAHEGGDDRVRAVQRALRRLGLVPLRVTSRTTGRPILLTRTGQFGPVTESGVRRFQRRTGLRVSGVVDGLTLQRLTTISEPGFDQRVRRTPIRSRP